MAWYNPFSWGVGSLISRIRHGDPAADLALIVELKRIVREEVHEEKAIFYALEQLQSNWMNILDPAVRERQATSVLRLLRRLETVESVRRKDLEALRQNAGRSPLGRALKKVLSEE